MIPFAAPFLPTVYRWVAIIFVALGFGALMWVKGAHHAEKKYTKIIAAQQVASARLGAKREVITAKADVAFTKVREKIVVVTERQIHEVTKFVSVNDCPMSPGFRVFHDAAAAGQIPDPAAVADAAFVPAETIATTVATNYGACLSNQKQLDGLQEWVKAQVKLNNQRP